MARRPNYRAKKFSKKVVKKPQPVAKPPASKFDVKVRLLEQEIRFAQALAGHEPQKQVKVLKNLKKWLTLRSKSSYPFTDQDFLRLWKGLFYAMWMSDKPLVQEQLAEDLGGLLHCFTTPEVSLQFYGVFLQSMNREWYGIDQWRIDKFMMLIRRVTRQALVIIRDNNWRLDLIKSFRKSFKRHIFGGSGVSIGLSMHFLDIYIEEISKVSEGKVKKATVTSLIRPFTTLLGTVSDARITSAIVKNIFNNLLHQSELGRRHREKYEAWRSFGFPTGNIDDLEMVEDVSEAEENEEEDQEMHEEKTALDPRAGRVNVVLPEIKFNPKAIMKALEKTLYASETKSKARKKIKGIIDSYEKLSQGIFPLGIHKMPVIREEARKMPDIEDKIGELEDYEKSLLHTTELRKSLTKSERRRFMNSGMSLEDFVKKLGKDKPPKTNGFVLPEEEEAPPKKRKKLSRNDSKPSLKKKKKQKAAEDPWQEPLQEGEMEYFVPSMKKRLEQINGQETAVINPFAIKKAKKELKKKLKQPTAESTPSFTPSSSTSSARKRVRIALEMNTSQDTLDYIKQVRSSPQIPYDSTKKPVKGLLKPNLMPGPINPYYKRKIQF
ncbi:Ribosomal RNA processing protein 1 homolog [Sergentomyia squamirostris]